MRAGNSCWRSWITCLRPNCKPCCSEYLAEKILPAKARRIEGKIDQAVLQAAALVKGAHSDPEAGKRRGRGHHVGGWVDTVEVSGDSRRHCDSRRGAATYLSRTGRARESIRGASTFRWCGNRSARGTFHAALGIVSDRGARDFESGCC